MPPPPAEWQPLQLNQRNNVLPWPGAYALRSSFACSGLSADAIGGGTWSSRRSRSHAAASSKQATETVTVTNFLVRVTIQAGHEVLVEDRVDLRAPPFQDRI